MGGPLAAQTSVSPSDTTIYITREPGESDMSILLGNSALNNLPFGAIVVIQDQAKQTDESDLNKEEQYKEEEHKRIEQTDRQTTAASQSDGKRTTVKEKRGQRKKRKRKRAPKWNAHKKTKKSTTHHCPNY